MKIILEDLQGVSKEYTASMPATVSEIRELCRCFYQYRTTAAVLRACCAILVCCGVLKSKAKYSDTYDPMEFGAVIYEDYQLIYSPVDLQKAASILVVDLLYPRLEPSVKAIQSARNFLKDQEQPIERGSE